MMDRIHIFIIYLFVSLCTYSQGILKGQVLDKGGKPLPSVIVKVFDDAGQKMLAYGTTDGNGNYSIDVKQSIQRVTIRINAFGYTQEERKLEKFGDNVNFILKESEVLLKEVSVRAKPVTIHGDTINYNVTQLKDKTDRKIEDVIRKIPGIEIEGSIIKYNGKPINKFYIEGADMLGGRYSLASKNINADDVATINVYQNHQPKRALKDIETSNQAALNLKLKNNRMLNPIGYANIGMGYGDETLWKAESFTLLISPQRQFLVTAKGNNMSQSYKNEISDSFNEVGDMHTLVANRLRPIHTDTSYVPAARTQYNRSASFTYHSLHKLTNDLQLNVNGGYHFNQTRSLQDKKTTFWTGGNSAIVVEENNNNRTNMHQGWLTLKFERNSDTHYLNAQLKAEGEMCNYRDKLTGNNSLKQNISTGSYIIAADIESVWRKGNRAFNLLSFTTFSNTPQNHLNATTTTTTVIDSLLLSQHLKGIKFHTQESTTYSWILSRIARLSLNASFQADYDRINSSLEYPSLDNQLRYGGVALKTEVKPALSLSGNNVSGSFGAVAQLDNLHYKDHVNVIHYDYDKPQIGVRASFTYRMGQRLRLMLGTSYMHQLGNMMDYVTQPVYVTYRDLSIFGMGMLNARDKTSSNINLTYRNLLTGFNAHVMATYQHIHSNIIKGSLVTDEQTISHFETRGNATDMWTFSAGLSRNIYDWHTIFSITGDSSVNNMERLRQGIFSNINNCFYSLEGNVKSTILHDYVIFNLGGRYTLSTQSMQNSTSYSNDFRINAGISIFPLACWGVYIRSTNTFIQVPSGTSSQYSSCYYLDAGTNYTFGKFEIELAARNITNQKLYQLRVFSACDTYNYTYYLRPLECSATLRYSF